MCVSFLLALKKRLIEREDKEREMKRETYEKRETQEERDTRIEGETKSEGATFKTLPCVRSERSRVYFQNARVLCDTGALKPHRERFESTHGSVTSNLSLLSISLLMSAPLVMSLSFHVSPSLLISSRMSLFLLSLSLFILSAVQ